MNTACTKVQFTPMQGIASNQEEMKKRWSCSGFPEGLALEGYQRYYRQSFNLSHIKHARIKVRDTDNGDSFTYTYLERTRAWPRKCLSLIEKKGHLSQIICKSSKTSTLHFWRDLRFFSSLSHSFLSFYLLSRKTTELVFGPERWEKPRNLGHMHNNI